MDTVVYFQPTFHIIIMIVLCCALSHITVFMPLVFLSFVVFRYLCRNKLSSSNSSFMMGTLCKELLPFFCHGNEGRRLWCWFLLRRKPTSLLSNKNCQERRTEGQVDWLSESDWTDHISQKVNLTLATGTSKSTNLYGTCWENVNVVDLLFCGIYSPKYIWRAGSVFELNKEIATSWAAVLCSSVHTSKFSVSISQNKG